MSRKKTQKQRPTPTEGEFLYRIAVADVERVDTEQRALDLVLATETPVKAYDLSRGEVVDEVLRLNGMELPKQVPLLDSHQRESVRNVLGSIRDLRVENGRLLGRATFASDPESVRTFNNYSEGHLSDVSVGALRMEVKYEGDRRIVTRSKLVEGSAVTSGADPNAKALPRAMRAYADPYSMRDEAMFEELKALLIERGLDKDADDKAVLEFIGEKLTRGEDEDAKQHNELLTSIHDELKRIQTPTVEGVDVEKLKADLMATQRDERERVSQIDALCRRWNADDADRQKWISEGTDPHEVSDALLKRLDGSGEPLGLGRIDFGTSSREKFYEAVRSGVLARSGVNPAGYVTRAESHESKTGLSWGDREALERAREDVEDIGKPADGWKEFRYMRTPEIARRFCEIAGVRTNGLPDHEICRKAIGLGDFVERASDGASFHTTGSFTNLYLDAMHKTLRRAYDEAPSTYQRWVRQAPSASDYKTLHRIVFGEIGMPDEVAENDEYPEKTASDSRENYRVAKHGAIFSISLEMLVNDDLNAMQRVPQMQGNSMRRKINRAAYSILVDNDTLTADSIALFHATSHGANLDTGALAEGTLDTGFNVMETQTGLDSTTVLGIMPRFLIVPSALAATAFRLTGGNVVPETVANVPLYGTGGPRPLEVVVDGQIDNLSSSTTIWWLAADNSVVDTVEITFLQGEESPALERENGFTTDTIKYKIRQSWAVKAIDFRGLYQGNT